MRFHTKTLLAILILASASNAFAGSTAELRVIGSVIPGACKPEFAGGAVVDYGNISQSDLSATASTTLQTRRIAYTITCDAPITIATAWTDNRAGSANIPGQTVFGLGLKDNVSIGHYFVDHVMAGALGDGMVLRNIFSRDNGATWLAASGRVNPAPNNLLSYAVPGTLIPVPYKDYSGALDVTAVIVATELLDMTTPIVLDGLSTMEVRYL